MRDTEALHLIWHADVTDLLAQSAYGDRFLKWMVLRTLHLDDSGFFGTQIEEIEVIFKI